MTNYTKLKSGDWGVRTTDDVKAGDTLTVTLKSGSTKQETIARVLWSGNGVSLCAVKERPKRSGSGCACGSGSSCCSPRCQCDPHCVCRGGNIYDC